MWGRKKERIPQTEIGEWRIVEVTLKNGRTNYEAQQYSHMSGFETTYRKWGMVKSFDSLERAKVFVNTELGNTEASRKVVWP